MSDETRPERQRGFLGFVERAGNLLPDPTIIFVYLIFALMLLFQQLGLNALVFGIAYMLCLAWLRQPFVLPLPVYHQADVISRASDVMAQCAAIYGPAPALAAE